MKRKHLVGAALLSILLVLTVLLVGAGGTVKEPAVAGAFYPADKQALTAMVDDFLSRAKTTPVEGKLIALIAPHAGYQYSGQVAAYAYRHLQERPVDTVILIGPSHYAEVNGAVVYASGGMRTPLGTIKINDRLAKKLIDPKAGVTASTSAFEKEHSIEVQLPFLQRTLTRFTIVPVLIGRPTQESFDSLIRSLTSIVAENPKTIIIASTDLSHYHDYRTAKKMDGTVTNAVARMSVEDLEQRLRSSEGEMCGGYAVLVAMAAARRLGATNGVLFNAANSGDVTNDRTRVVGYAALGLYKSALTAEQQRELLALARRTIESYVKHGKTPQFEPKDARLAANGAVFVTINRSGRLRGCIGNIEPVMPLFKSVITNAVSACSRDPRFEPMTPQELNDMSVEVTVLSPLELLLDVKNIRIGTHGLYLVKGWNSGILLPQVAEEYHWDVPTFLEQVSIKAGLPKDAWKDAQLYSFTADIIR